MYLRPLLLPVFALAAPPLGEPAEVRLGLGRGAVVNWTHLAIEAEDSRAGTGVTGRQAATEQLVRQSIGPAIEEGLADVSITSVATVADLMTEPEVGEKLRNRVKLWTVSEATYFASGRVALHGRIDLAEYLRPWSLTRPAQRPETPTVSEYTGLVVDARVANPIPCFAPSLVADSGEVLWDGRVWEEVVLTRTPATWVADPAHPASGRAGPAPLVVTASAARGCDLTLDREGSQEVRRHLVGSPALGEGKVVVVVRR
jgi:hypothetical protein